MNCKFCNLECEHNPSSPKNSIPFDHCKPCHVVYTNQNGRDEIEFPRFIGSRSITLVVHLIASGDTCKMYVWDFDGVPDSNRPDQLPNFSIKEEVILPKDFAKHLTPSNAADKIKTYLTFS